MTTTSRPIGSKAKLNGKVVVWSGPDYGWQSPATHNKLEKQGKFRIGARELDQVGKFLQPAVQQVQRFQREFRRQTDKIGGQHLENAANKAMLQDDKLPSSRVGQGAGIIAQNAGNALNLDPRIAGAIPFLLGSVKVGGIDDAAKAVKAKARPPRMGAPIVAPPHATGLFPPRVDIQPGIPGPRPKRRLPEDSQARIAAQRAGGRGDPLADGRAAAGADPPSKYQQYGASELRPFSDLPAVKQQRGPKQSDPVARNGTVQPLIQGDGPKATQAEMELRAAARRGNNEQPNSYPRTDYGPHERTAATRRVNPTYIAEGKLESRDQRARQRQNNTQDTLRLQGQRLGAAPGSVTTAQRPKVTSANAPVGRDVIASDRNPWAGKPIGGQPMTREEFVRMRRLEAEHKLDIKPEKYRATGSNRPAEYVDPGDYKGDRFADDAGFSGDESNLGFSVKQNSATGEGKGRRGPTGAIRTQFDVTRARADLVKKGIDPGLQGAMKAEGINLDALRNPNLAPKERNVIKAQIRDFKRRYKKEYQQNRQIVRQFIADNYHTDKFGNKRPFETKTGKTSSTLNDQVTALIDERRFPEQYNQIEARDNNYVELPVKKEAAVDPRRVKAGPRYKTAKDAKRSDNMSGGMRIPQTPVDEVGRDAIREQRARARASQGGRGANDGGVNWKDYEQPSTKLKTAGRDRHKGPGRKPGTATSPAERGFQDQLRRQRKVEQLYVQRLFIDNALPITMEDAVKQLRKHHGSAAAERILDTPVGHHGRWTDDGRRIPTPEARTVRDVLEEDIYQQRLANRERERNRPGLVPREAKPISSVGPVDTSNAKGRHRSDPNSVSVRGKPDEQDAARYRYLDVEPVLDKNAEAPKKTKKGARPKQTYKDTPKGKAQREFDAWRTDLRTGRPTTVPVSQNSLGGQQRQLRLDLRGKPTVADIRPEHRPGIRRSQRRLDARVTSRERIAAWDAATAVQSFYPSALEWEGPSFRTRAEARKAGEDAGRILVAPVDTKDGKMPNKFQPDGELRDVSTRGRATKGNKNELTKEEIKRRKDLKDLKDTANGLKIRTNRHHQADVAKAKKAKEELLRRQAEMERIRAARARRRSGR